MKNFVAYIFLVCIFGLNIQVKSDSLLTLQNVQKVANYQMSFEEISNITISTVSKRIEKLSEAPGIVSIITSSDIRAYGASSLWDLMNKVPSIQPLSSHLFRKNKMSLRGDLIDHADNHVLILLNGRPLREGFNTGQNFSVYMTFPLDVISRIEVIRGPGSVLYGTNAFAGVINIITKKGNEVGEHSFAVGGGNHDTNIQKFTSYYDSEDFNAIFSFFRKESTGWDFSLSTSHPSPALPTLNDSTDYAERSMGMFANISWGNLQINSFYSETKYDMLGIIPYWSRASRNLARRGFIDAGYLLELSDKWKVQSNVTFNYYDLRIDQSEHIATDTIIESFLHGHLSDDVDILFGGLVNNLRRNERISESPIPVSYSTYDYAIYAQLDYKILNNLKFTTGAQYIFPEAAAKDIVPRFGLVYNINENWGLKILHSDSFRSAGPVEQLIMNPVLLGNPNLEPEKIQTTDIHLFYETEKQSYYLTWFCSEYSELITRLPTGVPGQTMFGNSKERVKVQGLEFEFKYKLSEHWFLNGSSMYQKTQNDKMLAPNFMAKMVSCLI